MARTCHRRRGIARCPRAQWKAFLTTFAAWVLDAFDFTILTFVLADIQQSFSVNKALAGLLGTVTLLFRVVGGIGAGTLADRYGRKGPILFSIALVHRVSRSSAAPRPRT